MNKILEEIKSTDSQLYNALVLLIDRLKADQLNHEVAKTVAPKMKIKELSNIIFSFQKVKIVHHNETLFNGYANELPNCYYKDCQVKTIASAYTDRVISIMIEEVIEPER